MLVSPCGSWLDAQRQRGTRTARARSALNVTVLANRDRAAGTGHRRYLFAGVATELAFVVLTSILPDDVQRA